MKRKLTQDEIAYACAFVDRWNAAVERLSQAQTELNRLREEELKPYVAEMIATTGLEHRDIIVWLQRLAKRRAPKPKRKSRKP